MSADVMRLAQNLARNCGYAVFPCRSAPNNKAIDKTPTWPKREGGQGFKDASIDPDRIAWMWDRWPGELIGIATGTRSGVAALDVDRKHPEAIVWWQDHHRRLLPTRTFATRSGGLHLYFRHRDGVTSTQGKICRGVDTRGEGGYAIAWFAAGLHCRDHSQPAAWPDWLHAALTPLKRPAEPYRGPAPAEAAIAGIVRKLAQAQEGARNAVLFWAAYRCVERGMRQGEIEALLLPIATSIGLSHFEARRTIGSARGRAVA